MHAVDTGAPTVDDHKPALHKLHEDDAERAHVPVIQVKQVAADVAINVLDHVPALQLLHKVAPAEDHVPALQVEHFAASGMEEYVPGRQMTHVFSLSLRYWPGGQAIEGPLESATETTNQNN